MTVTNMAPVLTTPVRALAGALRRLFAESPMSVRRLAEQIGRPHASLSGWQHGQRVPSLDDLNALLTALDMPPGESVEIVELWHAAQRAGPDDLGRLAWTLGDAAAELGATPAAACRVLEVLAAHCEPTAELCETTLTATDLRVIAAHLLA